MLSRTVQGRGPAGPIASAEQLQHLASWPAQHLSTAGQKGSCTKNGANGEKAPSAEHRWSNKTLHQEWRER